MNSKQPVYTLKKLDEPLKPGGKLELQTAERPELSDEAWQIHEEPQEGEEFGDLVITHVMAGNSCNIEGPPGTGKSHLLARIRDALTDVSTGLVTIAPTNSAARLVQGQTIHAFLTRMASSSYGWPEGTILVDECSMLSLALVACLDNLRQSGTRIITSGDWRQLPPVGNSWRGTPCDPGILQHSTLLKRWSDGHCFRLTRCRRSDPVHFLRYVGLSENITDAIAQVRAAYPPGSDEMEGLHLTISHRHRRMINEARQQAFAGGDCVVIPAQDGEAAYRCCDGTPLIGSCTGHSWVNGAFYEVVQPRCPLLVRDTLTDTVFETTPELLVRHTCLAHAIVYNRAQGCTIRDQLVILHSFQSRFFQRAHLYVGLSRPADGSQIRVA